jgi:hypothetical protein
MIKYDLKKRRWIEVIMKEENKKPNPHTLQYYMSLTIVIIIAGFFMVVAINFYPFHINDGPCKTNNEKHITSGMVATTSYIGDCIKISFDDNRFLYLHNSGEAKYDGWEMIHLLVIGSNYSFSYHNGCVESDSNTPFWFEGNIIDEIRVNN